MFSFLPDLDSFCDNLNFTEIDQGWLHRSYVCQGEVVVKDLLTSTKIIFTFPETNREVKYVSTGWNEVFVVADDGSCWFGKLSGGERAMLNKLVTADVTSARVKSVDASGDFKTLLLFEDGRVGEVTRKDDTVTIVPVAGPSSIQSVACGKEHALFLTLQGNVFSYGFGSRGQLGHGHVETLMEPTLIDALDGISIKCISAGGWHSAAISHDGDAYIWGWNESGQLGFPNDLSHDIPKEEVLKIQALPKLLDFSDDIENIGCGSRHTVALTKDNVLWSWGWNDYGQLGLLQPVQKPTPISLPASVRPPFMIQARHWTTLVSSFTL